MNAHEALVQVKNMVDATVAEIAPDAELSPDAAKGGTSCESSLSGPTGQRSYGYGSSFPMPDEATGERLVRETARFWRTEGHRVTGSPEDPISPSVRTGEGGFTYRFLFTRTLLRAFVGGSTPCVNPLPGDSAEGETPESEPAGQVRLDR
jgi:hypothetical protein